MTLSAPAPRRHRHTRTILCEGFDRDDGLWDVEGRIVDRKPYHYVETYRGERGPEDAMHDMAVRITFDRDMIVRAIEVAMPSAPYVSCQDAKPSFSGLVGRTIGAGWRGAIHDAAGGVKGCTHVRELLLQMATVAFQTRHGWRRKEEQASEPSGTDGKRPYFINGCKGWALDGDVVKDLYPQFYHAPRRKQA